MTTALREQLAAAIVEGEDRLPGLQIAIVGGFDGSWSVCVQNAYTAESTPSIKCMWLASARTPSVMRKFKTLDAAHNAAVEIHRLTDPENEHRTLSISVIVLLPKEPK